MQLSLQGVQDWFVGGLYFHYEDYWHHPQTIAEERKHHQQHHIKESKLMYKTTNKAAQLKHVTNIHISARL